MGSVKQTGKDVDPRMSERNVRPGQDEEGIWVCLHSGGPRRVTRECLVRWGEVRTS